jgi:hypothetical protein
METNTSMSKRKFLQPMKWSNMHRRAHVVFLWEWECWIFFVVLNVLLTYSQILCPKFYSCNLHNQSKGGDYNIFILRLLKGWLIFLWWANESSHFLCEPLHEAHHYTIVSKTAQNVLLHSRLLMVECLLWNWYVQFLEGKKKAKILLFMFTNKCKTKGAWIILAELMVS